MKTGAATKQFYDPVTTIDIYKTLLDEHIHPNEISGIFHKLHVRQEAGAGTPTMASPTTLFTPLNTFLTYNDDTSRKNNAKVKCSK